MNWITKIIKAGEKIKTAFHKRASKEDIAKSVIGQVVVEAQFLKKDLEENLWVCPRAAQSIIELNPDQRFDILIW